MHNRNAVLSLSAVFGQQQIAHLEKAGALHCSEANLVCRAAYKWGERGRCSGDLRNGIIGKFYFRLGPTLNWIEKKIGGIAQP